MAPLRETDGDGPAALPDNTTTAASVKSEANVPIPKPNPRLNPLFVKGESASAGSLRESQARGQHAAAAAPPPDDARLEQHLDALMARISDRVQHLMDEHLSAFEARFSSLSLGGSNAYWDLA